MVALRGALGLAVSIKPSTADAAFGFSSSSLAAPPAPPASSSLQLSSSLPLLLSSPCARRGSGQRARVSQRKAARVHA
jgi:hypothetical protein